MNLTKHQKIEVINIMIDKLLKKKNANNLNGINLCFIFQLAINEYASGEYASGYTANSHMCDIIPELIKYHHIFFFVRGDAYNRTKLWWDCDNINARLSHLYKVRRKLTK